MRTLAILAALAAATPAEALDKRFDPARNGPWTVLDLGRSDAVAVPSHDPKALVAGPDGDLYLAAKRPVDGPPTGGDVFRVGDAGLEPMGGPLAEEPAALLVDGDAIRVGTKGTLTDRTGHLLALDPSGWTAQAGAAFASEVTGVVRHAGALHVATQSGGVHRVEGGVVTRVGVRTEVLQAGYAWTAASDDAGDVEAAVRLPDDSLAVVGKDLQVRLVEGGLSTVLGNLSEATYDEAGTILSYVREPKGIAVGPLGELYVGTKGRAGSAEGANRGVVWTWTGSTWTSLSAGVAMATEVKSLAFSEGLLYAGTSETGVWCWDGLAWSQLNEGLPLEGAKVKGNELALGADGLLYVMSKNALYGRAPGAAAFAEVGFFPLGEEVKSVAVDGAGVRHVGAKVGAGAGAVYRQEGAGFVQLGEDLPLEAKRLVFDGAGALHVALGGTGGAYRWDGAGWTSITGALDGAASAVKDLLALPGGQLLAVTKQGIWRGQFREAPLTVIRSALEGREVKSLLSVGGELLAVAKKGGVFRLVPDAAGDDGTAWADADAGLPDVEIEGATALDGEVWLLGKQLLYRGVLDEALVLQVAPVGGNPGKAALDGDGRLVFTGETSFTAVARDARGRLFAGTKDGLFVAESPGAAWTLFNGPAEVKGLSVQGDRIVAVVKGELTPDPAAPTATVKTAQVWIGSLAAAPAAGLPPGSGAGCSSGPGGAGALLLAATALASARARRRRGRGA